MAIALFSDGCAPTAAAAEAPGNPLFGDALYERIERDGHLPAFARLEIAPVSAGLPTFTFRDPDEVILQLNVYGFPDPKGTSALVPLLIDAGSGTAARHALSLTGIEIVFHRRDGYNPMQVWAATPPWSAEQTSLTAVSAGLIESMRPTRE